MVNRESSDWKMTKNERREQKKYRREKRMGVSGRSFIAAYYSAILKRVKKS